MHCVNDVLSIGLSPSKSSVWFLLDQQLRFMHSHLINEARIMLNPPMFVKCEDSPFTLSALVQVNGSMYQLVSFSLSLGDNVSVGINDARPSDKGPMILLASLGCMHAIACVLVAACLARQAMMKQRFFLLLGVFTVILWCKCCRIISFLLTEPIALTSLRVRDNMETYQENLYALQPIASPAFCPSPIIANEHAEYRIASA